MAGRPQLSGHSVQPVSARPQVCTNIFRLGMANDVSLTPQAGTSFGCFSSCGRAHMGLTQCGAPPPQCLEVSRARRFMRRDIYLLFIRAQNKQNGHKQTRRMPHAASRLAAARSPNDGPIPEPTRHTNRPREREREKKDEMHMYGREGCVAFCRLVKPNSRNNRTF